QSLHESPATGHEVRPRFQHRVCDRARASARDRDEVARGKQPQRTQSAQKLLLLLFLRNPASEYTRTGIRERPIKAPRETILRDLSALRGCFPAGVYPCLGRISR